MKKLSKDLVQREMDELAAFEPTPGMPFISLYLNA